MDVIAASAFLRMYERGEVLFEAGQSALDLVCLMRGSVRLVQWLPDGQEKVIHLLQGPALVAEAPPLLGEPYPATATTTESCVVVAVPRVALLQAAQKNPEIPWKMMAALFLRLKELTGSLRSHGQKNATSRLGSYLLGISEDRPYADLPAPKKDVASFLGLRPESLSRALAVLQEEGAITVREQRIDILDRERLQSFLDEG